MPTTIRSDIDIAAPVDRVWKILVDLGGYPEWNPFTPRVDSTLRVGEPVTLTVQMRPTKQLVQVETISGVESGRRLCWGMKLVSSMVLAANRCQVLTPTPAGGTHYSTSDEFRGALVPVVMRLYGRDIQRGFDGVAAALKARAET